MAFTVQVLLPAEQKIIPFVLVRVLNRGLEGGGAMNDSLNGCQNAA